MRLILMIDQDGHAVSGTFVDADGNPCDDMEGMNVMRAVELFEMMNRDGDDHIELATQLLSKPGDHN